MSDRQILATIPGNATSLFFSVTNQVQGGIGPCHIHLEYVLSGVAFSMMTAFCPYQGVVLSPIGSSSATKNVVAYWRGDRIYSWTVSW